MLQPVVIGQDEQTELHVQAVIQSGRRQLDIRIWRRGPTGFAPSRSALTLEVRDVEALLEGIAELLEASDGGRQVARVVWDKDEGRRLRAETEPFGTHFLARLGFWQRVRDSWRPVGDGLQLDAAQLKPLQEVIESLQPRLLVPETSVPHGIGVTFQATSLQRWPTPGADWLTIDPDRLAFHPRGIRITATIEEDDNQHRLILRQWRRDETLWIPEDVALELGVPDLDTLLMRVRHLADSGQDESEEDAEIPCAGGSTARVALAVRDGQTWLEIAEKPPGAYVFEPRLSIPAQYVPQFGRMLAQSGMLLIMRLSEEERTELQNRQGPEIAPAIVSDALIPSDEPEEIQDETDRAAAMDPTSSRTAVLLAQRSARPAPPKPVRPPPPPREEPEETARRLRPLGELRLGRQSIFLYLQEEEGRHLSLQWDGRSLLVPVDHVPQMIDDLRTLYYDALKGRRGHVSTVGGVPSVHMSVHNQGSTLTVVLEHEIAGKTTRLMFPVGEVPTFLNAATAALPKMAVANEL